MTTQFGQLPTSLPGDSMEFPTLTQVLYGAGYRHGFGDGEHQMLALVQNALASNPSSRAIYAFIRAAIHDDSEEVMGAAVGIFDGQLYVWIVLEDIDVKRTRKLFDLKSAIEQSEQTQFELHVAARQGRPIAEAIPRNFQLVDF